MMILALAEINWVAVLVATAFAMLLGWLWYGPLLGRQWAKAQGVSFKALKQQARATPPALQAMFLYMAMAVTLAIVLAAVGANTLAEGFGFGLLLGVGLLGMAHARQIVFNGNGALILINIGYDILVTVIMGMIIAGWR